MQMFYNKGDFMNTCTIVIGSCLLLHSFSINMTQAQSVETPPKQATPSTTQPATQAAAPAPAVTTAPAATPTATDKVAEEAKKKEAEQKKTEAAAKTEQAKKAAAEAPAKEEAEKKAAQEKKAAEEKVAEEKKKTEAEEEHKKEQEKKEAEQKAAEEKKHAEEEAKKKEEQQKAAAAHKEEKPKPVMTAEGMDTLEQEGGNWLLKRQALEKTVDLIEQINGFFTKILEARIDFLVKRNKIDRDFDVFISKIGFEFGDIARMLSTLIEELEQQRKAIGELPEEERQALTDLDSKQKELQDLQQQLKETSDLILSLDDVIMQLEKEINIANSYQANAWKNFQAIKKVLNDEKAEELYLETQGLLKNMQAIDAYLKDKLFNYFNGIIDNIKKGMSTIQASFKSLEDKGVDLKAEIEKFLNINQTKLQDKVCEEADKKRAEAIQKVKTQKTSEGLLSWIAPLWEYPLHFFDSAWNFIMSFFTSSEVQVAKRPMRSEKSAKESETKEANRANKV